jgi:hypothetical protein
MSYRGRYEREHYVKREIRRDIYSNWRSSKQQPLCHYVL